MAAAMPSPQGGSGHGMLPDVDGEIEDKFLAEFAREFMQRGASLELPASLNEFGGFPSPGIELPQQELASSIAADYPHFYGGAAVPTRDAEFEAWHGPLGGAPQQRQQQQQPFPTLSNPVQAPPRAGVMGMPALPLPNDSQSFPQYLQQYDAGFRGSDPMLGQPSFGTSAQTSAGVASSQQQSFISQSMPPIGNGISAAAPVDHAMPQTTLGFGFDARSIAAMPHIVSSSAMLPEPSTSNSDEGQPLGLKRNSTGGSGGSTVGAGGGRSLRKSNSGGSAASAEREYVLSGAIKKDSENGADKMARQLSKFKEKNRTAQKRYRERQKSKLQDSEEKVAELTEQLNALKVEKETLANRNALLEKFLAMQQQQQQAGSTSIVEGEKEAWWLDDRTKRLIEQTMRLNGTLTFTVRPGTPLQLTREQIADLPVEEFEALWSEYVNAYAECLLKANNDASSPAGKRLAQLVYECGQIKGSIAMTHPDRIHSGKVGDDRAHHLCVSNTADSKDVTRLLEMIGSIHLGDEQKKILLSLRKLYLQNLGILVRRRQDLSTMLQGGYPLGDKAALVADVYLRTVATMDKLRETLRDEHSFLIQFMLTVWRRVLTPFQVAQLTVQTYPLNADILAMINALAEDMGEPPAAEVVRQGGELKDTALVPIDTAAAMLPSSFNGHPVYQPPDAEVQQAPPVAPQSVRSGAGPTETGAPPQPSPQWVPL